MICEIYDGDQSAHANTTRRFTYAQQFRNIYDCRTVTTRVCLPLRISSYFVSFHLQIRMDSAACASTGYHGVTSVKSEEKAANIRYVQL